MEAAKPCAFGAVQTGIGVVQRGAGQKQALKLDRREDQPALLRRHVQMGIV